MKEATGELNMTVVTVVAIAAVGAFFYVFIWPAIQTSILQSTYCATAYSCEENNDGETMSCSYRDKDGDEQSITCDVNDTSNSVN